jgi:signal peptidase II
LALRNLLRKYGLLISIAGVIIFFDQWTKAWVRNNIPFGEIWTPIPGLEEYARIVHWRNTGAAFGLFQDLSIVFTVLAVVVSIAIIYYYPRIPRGDWPLRLALGLQLGGAIGNLIDRLLFSGHVTDFISVHNFAVFNIADACISLGVAVLVIGIWIKERQQPPDTDQEEMEGNSSLLADQQIDDISDNAKISRKSMPEEYWGD